MKLAAERRVWTPQAEHRSSIGASPQKNGIARKVAMRELQSDDLNVESLRCLGIGHGQMRFVQMHVRRLHALRLPARDYSFDDLQVFPSISLNSRCLDSRYSIP